MSRNLRGPVATRLRTSAMRVLRATMLVAAVLTHGVGGDGEECRIEIVSPETGDTLPAGAGLVLELGLVDCPVPFPARCAPRVC